MLSNVVDGSDDEVEWLSGLQEVRGRRNSRLNQQESASACLGAVLLSCAPHWLEGRLAEGADPSLTFLLLAPGSSASVIIARSSVSNPRNGECAASEGFVSVEGGGRARGGEGSGRSAIWVTMIEPCGYRARGGCHHGGSLWLVISIAYGKAWYCWLLGLGLSALSRKGP